MAYIEIYKSGKIVTRRFVEERKAQKGCKIRLGSAGEVHLTIGKDETIGEFTVRLIEGDMPEDALKREEKTSALQKENESALPLNFSTQNLPSSEKQETQTNPEIEGYRIIKKLGHGGMGEVWLAEQLGTKREVALKLMVSHASDSKKAKAKFQREVELTARLDHPNIAGIYDSGLHHGVYYYAMEYIDGLPLDKYVKYHNLTRKPILRLMQKVCMTVLYAHQRAVIHRDLKPSNIMVDEKGEPHVLDFGLAKALLDENSVAVSMEGQIAGTPAYMSPEQASGIHSDIDTRTDVFSLGVILYELLTGQSPHDLSGSVLDVLHNITEGNLIRPSQVNKRIDIEAEAIILKALSLNPDERYASAGMLGMDIKNYLEGEPLDALVPTTLYFLRKKALKHKKQVSITAAILLIILTTVMIAYTKVVRERAISRAAEARNKFLESEVADLRTKILTGTSEQAEAALSALEQKYATEHRKVEQLQQELRDAIRQTETPSENIKHETGFNFGKPVNLGEPINTPYLESSPVISSNGLALHFTSNRKGSINNSEDIWLSKRKTVQDPWGVPENMGTRINSTSNEIISDWVFIKPLISSDRPGGYGDFDLYNIRLNLKNNTFEEPNNMGSVLNSKSADLNACLSGQGRIIYFNSNRVGGFGGQDIWFSTRASLEDPWEPSTNLGSSINGPWTEEMPYVPLNGLLLLFVSDRPGGYGKKDIFLSRRNSVSEPWCEPVNLGPEVNSAEDDEFPFILADNSAIMFSSTREGGSGDSDLWQIPIIPNTGFSFSNPVNLGSIINSSYIEYDCFISSNGQELYFSSTRPEGYGGVDLYISKRTSIDGNWSKAENLGSTVNSDSNDGALYITSDNLSLFFSSDRPKGFGNMDIWMASRATKNDDWLIPINLGPIINTSYYDGDPYLSNDGLTLYFNSSRPGGYGNLDIWFSTRKTMAESWSEPINFGPTFNSNSYDADPRILADGLLLIYSSNRKGGYGSLDLWLSRRSNISEPWETPINLGLRINSPRSQTEPFVSEKDSSLFFTSNRIGGLGNNDIWKTSIIQSHDLNRDGRIDNEDLEILIKSWGKGLSAADIAPAPFGDGQVDEKDLKLLMQNME